MLQAEAEEACEVEFENSDGLTEPQCARLEQFEDFVRQMVGEGHIVNFVMTLQSLSHANKRRLAKDLEAAGVMPVPSPCKPCYHLCFLASHQRLLPHMAPFIATLSTQCFCKPPCYLCLQHAGST